MSERELLHTDRVLVVEGKYDAARLSHLTDALILLTDGFGIYKDKKRQQLFKALAKKNGLILFTDSDAAGFRIRTYITNLVGAEHVVQAYVPAIHGKEKRKPQPGKEGLLGVEGVDDAIVLQALKDALGAEAGAAAPRPEGRAITYADLYDWGLSGTPGSAASSETQNPHPSGTATAGEPSGTAHRASSSPTAKNSARYAIPISITRPPGQRAGCILPAHCFSPACSRRSGPGAPPRR